MTERHAVASHMLLAPNYDRQPRSAPCCENRPAGSTSATNMQQAQPLTVLVEGERCLALAAGCKRPARVVCKAVSLQWVGLGGFR